MIHSKQQVDVLEGIRELCAHNANKDMENLLFMNVLVANRLIFTLKWYFILQFN